MVALLDGIAGAELLVSLLRITCYWDFQGMDFMDGPPQTLEKPEN